MYNWKEDVINLPNLKSNTSTTIVFKYIGNKEITTYKSSCGCSTPSYDTTTKELSVVYNTGSFPKHLQNSYTSTKYVTVFYSDGTKDSLSFNAIIYK